MSARVVIVVIAAPTSTTNITGFLIIVRGCSLAKASPMARLTIGGSSSGSARRRFDGSTEMTAASSSLIFGEGAVATGMVLYPCNHLEMFHHRAERQGGEES